MTTANKITIIRVALIPAFLICQLADFPHSGLLALIIFAAASLTDKLDGYIARKYNQVSTFGKFMDPLADKLLVVAAILVFVEWGQFPAWVAFLIIAREFAVTALRLVAVDAGVVLAAGASGKLKTAVSMLALCVMMTPLHGVSLIPALLTVDGLCVLLMLVTTLWSGLEYFIRNRKLLKMK